MQKKKNKKDMLFSLVKKKKTRCFEMSFYYCYKIQQI